MFFSNQFGFISVLANFNIQSKTLIQPLVIMREESKACPRVIHPACLTYLSCQKQLYGKSCTGTWSEIFGEWKKVRKQHDSFLLHTSNSLPGFFLGKFTCESTLDLQPFLCYVFFTSDQISELFSVIFIFLLFAFFLFIFSSIFSLSKVLFYISMDFYCILETQLQLVPHMFPILKKYFFPEIIATFVYIDFGTFSLLLHLGMWKSTTEFCPCEINTTRISLAFSIWPTKRKLGSSSHSCN